MEEQEDQKPTIIKQELVLDEPPEVVQYQITFCPDTEIKTEPELQIEEPSTNNSEETGEAQRFPCTKCTATYKGIKSLIRHEKEQHSGICYECPFCSNELKTPATVKRHMAEHYRKDPTLDRGVKVIEIKIDNAYIERKHREHEAKKFHCKMCAAAYNNSKTLEHHVRVHHSIKDIQCQYCGAEFSNKPAHSRHLNQHYKNDPNLKPLVGAIKKYTCEKCPAEFFNRHILSAHMKNSHSDEKFVCPHCQMQLKNSQTFRCHLRIHYEKDPTLKPIQPVNEVSNPFYCHHCSVTRPTKEGIERHLKIHFYRKRVDVPDADEREFQCSQCPAAYHKWRYLTKHVRNCHSDKRFECPHCVAVLKNHDKLRNHINRTHGDLADSGKFTCEQCGKKFSCDMYLRRHIRNVHEVVKVKCSYCTSILGKYAMPTHVFKIHKTEDGEFLCTDCLSVFGTGDELKEHHLWHLNGEPVEDIQIKKEELD